MSCLCREEKKFLPLSNQGKLQRLSAAGGRTLAMQGVNAEAADRRALSGSRMVALVAALASCTWKLLQTVFSLEPGQYEERCGLLKNPSQCDTGVCCKRSIQAKQWKPALGY